MNNAIHPIDPKYGVTQTDSGEFIVCKNKTGEPVPSDEPMILFRARDKHAINMLHFYRSQCLADGCTPEHMAGIENRIAAFREFAQAHPGRMKQPGITRGL